jgi:hypothetical protein
MASIVEPWVVEEFKKIVGAPDFIQQADSAELDELHEQLEAAQRELELYRDTVGNITELGPDIYSEGLQAKAAVVEALQARLDELQGQNPTIGSVGMEELFDQGTITDKRELLHSVIGSVFIRNMGGKAAIERKALILRHSELPAGLPKRGHRLESIIPFTWEDH